MLARIALALALMVGLGHGARAHTLGIESYFGATDLSYAGQVVYFDGEESRTGAMVRRPGQQAVRYNIGGVRYFGLLDAASQTATVYADGALSDQIGYADEMIDNLAPQLAFHSLVGLVELGRQTVNGVDASHNRITGLTRRGYPYAAEIWLSPEGAVIRVRGEVLGTPIRYDLYGYRVGPQDPADFALRPEDRP